MQIDQRFNKSKLFVPLPPGSRRTAAYVFAGIACFFVVFAYADYAKVDMSVWFGRCGFKQRYNLPCPTCGYTTAALAFSQGKILEAFYIQPAAGLLCLLMVITAIPAFTAAIFGVQFRFVANLVNKAKYKYVIPALVIIVLAGWAVTLMRALKSG
jgi:hypothetical protein